MGNSVSNKYKSGNKSNNVIFFFSNINTFLLVCDRNIFEIIISILVLIY